MSGEKITGIERENDGEQLSIQARSQTEANRFKFLLSAREKKAVQEIVRSQITKN